MRKAVRVTVTVVVGLIACFALGAAIGLALFQRNYGPSNELVYSTGNGAVLRLDIFEPENSDSYPTPAVLLFHGGAWTTGAPQQFYPYAKHFAERGWFAASAQYRLYGTHGTSAFDALDDARAAYRYLLDNAQALHIDPQRVVLVGGSAGGHLAAAVAMVPDGTDNPLPKPAALALLNPALDTDFPINHQIGRLFEGRGDSISPMHHMQPGLPPMLIVHGTEDTIVPFSESTTFCDAITNLGNRCSLKAHQGAGHGFWNWGTTKHAEVLQELVQFIGTELDQAAIKNSEQH